MSGPDTTHSNDVYAGPPLPTPDHIRILTLQPGSDDAIIECQLEALEHKSAPPYEALSYTWGDNSTSQVIRVTIPSSLEPQEYLVTANCFSALRRLRLSDRARILWIDALCIDQSNLHERNHQITLMPKIFSHAADVVIHLGEATKDSDLAVDFIVECDSPDFGGSSLRFPKSEALVEALEDFFQRPWFTRVWIISEVMLSRSGTVYCGTKALTWAAIKTFNKWNTTNKWLTALPFVVSTSKKALIENGLGNVFFNALVNARHCGATDPRDKLYALLPLLHEFDKQPILVPKYEDSVAKVYTECAKALVEDCGFGLLSAVQGGSGSVDLPSWVPDWSCPPRREILGNIHLFAGSNFWTVKKKVDAPQMPQLISHATTSIENSETAPPSLRVSGYLCGKITKIGSTYLAGQGPFPLSEWRALKHDDAVKATDRKEDVPLHHNGSSALDYTFHVVIGTKSFAYPSALERFLGSERDFERSKGDEVESEASKRRRSRVTWESTIHTMALKRSSGQAGSASDALPFREIPFHLAAKGQPPSYQKYVQVVVQNCHSRRFFITDNGYMGVAPEEAKAGDQIYHCVGAVTAFVLRESQGEDHAHLSRPYQLVGECHIEERAWRDLRSRSDAPQEIDVV